MLELLFELEDAINILPKRLWTCIEARGAITHKIVTVPNPKQGFCRVRWPTRIVMRRVPCARLKGRAVLGYVHSTSHVEAPRCPHCTGPVLLLCQPRVARQQSCSSAACIRPLALAAWSCTTASICLAAISSCKNQPEGGPAGFRYRGVIPKLYIVLQWLSTQIPNK
jgi:hypothetical protein